MRNKSCRALSVIGFSIFSLAEGLRRFSQRNIGLYGGYVADAGKRTDREQLKFLIAADTSQGGIFRYSTPTSASSVD